MPLDAIGMKVSLSELGITSRTFNTMYLEKLFDKISLNFHSMIRLSREIPENKLDIGTLASCARNIMESTNIFYYFSTAFSNKELLKFRHMIYGLNGTRNSDDIMEKLDISWDDPFGFGEFGRQSEILIIKENEYFKSLSADDKKSALSGSKRFYDMKSPRIVDENIESACYNLFSNSIHSLYGGISSNSLNPSYFNSKTDSVFLLSLAFEISSIYYANVIKEYLKKRHQLRKHLSPDEQETVDEFSKNTMLMKCIEFLKDRNKSIW